jgi:hypothetical protein
MVISGLQTVLTKVTDNWTQEHSAHGSLHRVGRRSISNVLEGLKDRTLGETRRNVCRVRANCESAEAGTEGTGETRGDGRDQTYLPGEMIAWGSSVFLISRTTCQNVVSFWDSQFIV